jgi:glycosyltransferase involved in cell wall biosynthesis
MRIILLTTRLNLGGVGVYTSSLARSLKAKGINVTIASSGGALLDEIEDCDIEHINLPIDTSAEVGPHILISYFKLSKVIKERNIQVVHAQTRVSQVIAHYLAKRNKISFISTCHGFFKPRFIRRKFPCWGERVIAISDAVKTHLINDMDVPEKDIRVIYNGIDIDRFSRVYSDQEKKRLRKEYGLRDAKTIGIIARLSDVKGHPYLFRAFKELLKSDPTLQLFVVGDGPSHYRVYLEGLVHDLKIGDNVIFHGSCRDTSKPLSLIDIFCLPSIQEGLGLAILEAMAMGIPVVASDVGGISTLVKDKQNGLLVPPRDEKALAGAVLKILSDTPPAKTMGILSKQMVKDKFSLEKMADEVIKVYQEVIKT